MLGNLKTRKMYDRGLLPHDGVTFRRSADFDSEDFVKEEPKSPFKSKRSQPATGRTEAYNFDEWSRLHYGYTRNRSHDAKEKREQAENQRAYRKEVAKNEYLILVPMLILLAMLSLTSRPNYDDNRIISNDVKKKES